jgi:hypothetical protein
LTNHNSCFLGGGWPAPGFCEQLCTWLPAEIDRALGAPLACLPALPCCLHFVATANPCNQDALTQNMLPRHTQRKQTRLVQSGEIALRCWAVANLHHLVKWGGESAAVVAPCLSVEPPWLMTLAASAVLCLHMMPAAFPQARRSMTRSGDPPQRMKCQPARSIA